METIKVERHYQGPQARFTHAIYLRYAGKLYQPKVVGFLWREQRWVPAGLRMSKQEAVVLFGGKLYRMGERSLKPLEMAAGEFFRPADWHKGEAFVLDWTTAHSKQQEVK